MKTIIPISKEKIELLIVLIFTFFLNNKAFSQYILDFNDASTYSTSCGTYTGGAWVVTDQNCTLTSSMCVLDSVPAEQTLLISITIQGSALDNADTTTIKYQLNGVWYTQTVIHGQPGLHTYVYSFYITANAGDSIMVSVNSTNNASTEKWRVFGGDIYISQNDPLPVKLQSFSAEKSSDAIRLEWVTASEINCSSYTVERSVDGKTFCDIQKIAGSGNSTTAKKYYTLDNNAYKGVNYYKLTQTDYDGTEYQAGKIISVDNSKDKESIAVFPNPNTGSSFFIDLNKLKGENILVVVEDSNGKELYSKIRLIDAHDKVIEVSDMEKKLMPGIYFVTAASENDLRWQKILVK